MRIRLVLNGKSADNPEVRYAVQRLREQQIPLEVRVTWEGGDAARLAVEACRDGVERVIAGGGDGSVNELLNGLMTVEPSSRAALAILPLGTANDFATSCGIPTEPLGALELAASDTPVAVDVGRANDKFFLNVASGGFGAEVTASTPPAMKRLLGGGAYSLMGAIMALNFRPYEARMVLPDKELTGAAVVGAVANGRQAGGGQQMAPRATIDDGLLDVLVVRHFELSELGRVAEELSKLDSAGKYLSYHQVPWVEVESEQAPLPVNLDGEPERFEKVRFEVVPRALRLIVPADCPLLSANEEPRVALNELSDTDPNAATAGELTPNDELSRARDILLAITDMGVSVALDDFGSGFSSLTHLTRFPLRKIKIDRMFMHDALTDAATEVVVRSMVDLARNMGIDVVAEGVEEIAQHEFLEDLGCQFGQGYFYGEPMTESAFMEWLQRRSPSLSREPLYPQYVEGHKPAAPHRPGI